MPVTVYGARVRQARILRRLKAVTVLAEMGWTGARQTRLEQADTTELGAADFQTLARLLQFPPAFLTTPPGSRVRPEDLLFQAPKTTTLGEKEYLAQFSALVGDFLDSMDSVHRLPAVRLPRIESALGVAFPAARVREALGVEPDQPIGHLVHELERAGVPVIVRPHGLTATPLAWETNLSGPLSNNHLGYSSWTGAARDRPLVVLRAVDSWERTRWELAHEIGQLALPAAGRKEGLASRFASELLAPRDAIALGLPTHVTLGSLLDMKLDWGIPIRPLLRHLFQTALISEHRYQALYTQLYTRPNPATGRSWGKTEPDRHGRQPELPRLLSQWAERCYRTAQPGVLTSLGLIWPHDLLEEMLLLQRPNPSPAASSEAVKPTAPAPERPVVIDFDSHQRRSHR